MVSGTRESSLKGRTTQRSSGVCPTAFQHGTQKNERLRVGLMKSLFIVALHGLKIQGNLGRGIRLFDTHLLTNDSDGVSSILTEHFKKIVGPLECRALLGDRPIIYAIHEHGPGGLASDQMLSFLNQQLKMVQTFLMCLWLVKDNAVNTELGFIEYPYKESSVSSVSSNYRPLRFCSGLGNFTTMEFTPDEIRRSRKFCNMFSADAVHHNYEGDASVVPRDFNRVERVMFYLQGARSSSDFGLKIALYITCAEALFCTDSSEVAHKLSERLAYFLGETPTERLRLFRAAKTAYGVRSKTLHGDKLSEGVIENIGTTSQQCDAILRDTISRILSDPNKFRVFTGPNEDLDEYLVNLTLGLDMNPPGTPGG